MCKLFNLFSKKKVKETFELKLKVKSLNGEVERLRIEKETAMREKDQEIDELKRRLSSQVKRTIFQIGIILFFVINFFKLTSPMK